jgi:Ca2+-transporting ATPase
MKEENYELKGLTSDQALELQEKYGKNELVHETKENMIMKIFHIILEPMFLLLLIAAIIYFILGEPRDGIIMLVFVVGIISIDVIQEWKTDKTLEALKDLSAPKVTVMRDGKKVEINSEDLVPGDLMLIYEGVKIPADGIVVKCSGICVDESSLTGEAEGVWKHPRVSEDTTPDYWKKDYCYAGTLVTQGTATVLVDKIGSETEYGKIGLNVVSAKGENSPLQKQTDALVKTCAILAGVLFVVVAIITYFNIPDHALKDRLIESILSGITLAMAMIPEEFPVVLTVFLSMGAWRLAKKNSLVKKLPSVETLGAVSVLCVDKTGTITKNEMTVEKVWSFAEDEKDLCEVMGLCCEEETYDPMEKAMLKYCKSLDITKKHLFAGEKLKEYAFTNETKMMGHTWHHDDMYILAAKGSSESILKLCKLTESEKADVEEEILSMAEDGLRVIAVGKRIFKDKNDIPATLAENELQLCGLVGLIDPPRDTVASDIALCNKAGIRVVMITGDNGITASSIAKKIGMQNCDHIITGDMLNEMSDSELREKVKDVSIFSRVIPEHKMRIVKAFKQNGEIVAMTGDGVNDAPALKFADIGIAMGKRGSEVSREAADLILLDDNFSTIVDTIKDGRRIYDNIRKAVGYIFVIHIPIAFASLLAPLLKISPACLLLLPLHVVLLELIIDPTCSIVLERQPAEEDIMDRCPRNPNAKLLTFKVLIKSIIQGLIMFGASFTTYYLALKNSALTPEIARSMGLVIIMIGNLFLVQVNSSDSEFVYKTFGKLIKDKVMIAIIVGTILGVGVILYSPINTYLKLAPLSLTQALLVILIAFVSVFWYEIVKLINKIRKD